jgi:hypothetical protein
VLPNEPLRRRMMMNRRFCGHIMHRCASQIIFATFGAQLRV